jgi:quercetin dioxygenase-like cupin family protein
VAAAQEKDTKKGAAAVPIMTSKAYPFDELPVRSNANGSKSRPVFNGMTTRGQHIVVHISDLPPGQAPHPPARQPHEEVIVIREGTLEVTLNGQVTTLGPGSVIFSAYNDLNGWKNVGTTPAQYCVISLEDHSG